MSNFVHKLKSWVNGDAFEDEAYGYDEDGMIYDETPTQGSVSSNASLFGEIPQASAPAMSRAERRKHFKVVEHPASANFGSNQAQVVVMEPRAFDEALDIIDHLKGRRAVILNLHLLDTAQSQRVVDFLSGATHAIEGHQQRIGDGVFMFTPSNVAIATATPSVQESLTSADAYWNTPR